jgi:hypothetical protein
MSRRLEALQLTRWSRFVLEFGIIPTKMEAEVSIPFSQETT